ncbi:MAG: TonB-dependent receptor, partial [Opitutales bacterium]|nr:TonB-dependent receptor [Opitutales bacterium]
EEPAAELEEFVVSAVRIGESDPLTQPLNSTYVGEAKIERSSALNVSEILEKEANIRFRSVVGSNASGDLSMRGFGENSQTRILVMVDGQKFNRADMGSINWLQIPLSEVESIEVLRGPMSSLYGSAAEAGVIKIKTKIPKEDGYSASVQGVYGSYTTYNIAARASGRADDIFFGLGGNFYHTAGWRENSAAEAKNVNLSIGKDFDENNRLVFSGSYTDSDTSYPGPISWEQYLIDPRKSDGKAQQSNSKDGIFALNFENNSQFGEGEAGLAMNFRDMDWRAQSRSDSLQTTTTFTPRYRVNVGENSHILAGFDGSYETLDYQKYYLNTSYKSSFAYVDRFSFSPYLGADTSVWDCLDISASGRFEASRLSAKNTEYLENTILPTKEITIGGKKYIVPNPDYGPTVKNRYNESEWMSGAGANFGLNYRFLENASVFFKFDQIYHYPTTDEVAAYQGYTMALPFNFDLKPETGQNYEVGAKYIFGGWTFTASAYLQYLQDEISFDNTQNMNVNLPDTRRYGVDLQISYDAKYGGASVFFSAVKAQFDAGEYAGKNIPLVPNFHGSAAVYAKPFEWLRLIARVNFSDSQYEGNDWANTARKIPSYYTFDFQANFQYTKYFSAFVSVENAFDEKYISCGWSGAYYPAMGRMIKAGINLKF